MVYKYYQEVEINQHYPYAKEISQWLYDNHGIQSPNGDKPATTLVNAMLNYVHEGEPKLYYNTRYGLQRVWPYGRKAAALLVHHCNMPGGFVEINGKKYRYTRKSM